MPRGLLAERQLADVERAVDTLNVTLGHAAGGELAVPRSLHSTHPLVAGVFGLRAFRNAASTSTSWCLLIGQPCSSKSTLTCALIGVEVSSVSMNSGRAYTAWVNSRTSLKLRSAWMPPAVAQAPMVTRARDCRRTVCRRCASCGVVTEPSTSDRS